MLTCSEKHVNKAQVGLDTETKNARLYWKYKGFFKFHFISFLFPGKTFSLSIIHHLDLPLTLTERGYK